ncbi:hypothetical protein GCM10020367_61920 [Streptomyces sannanensis]|uniref:ABC transporter permease n=1 Tax=Streptomyces sannanensis TaxID=285536 RepID=A0ABP6SKJ1_9ACTN
MHQSAPGQSLVARVDDGGAADVARLGDQQCDHAPHRRPRRQGPLTALTLAAGTVAVLGSLLAGRIVLPGSGFTSGPGQPLLCLADGPTLRAAVGSALYLALIALLGLGISVAVRDSAAAIGVALGLIYLFPVAIRMVSDPDWQRRLFQISPMNAGPAVQATIDPSGWPIGPWAGLGVLAAWAAAALLCGGPVLRMRDA